MEIGEAMTVPDRPSLKRPNRESLAKPFEEYLKTRLAQKCTNGKVLAA